MYQGTTSSMTTGIGHTVISSCMDIMILRAYLDGEVSSINVIPKEEISRISRISSNLKQLHQIVLSSAPPPSFNVLLTYCPWISPQTVIGASTSRRLGSDFRISPPLLVSHHFQTKVDGPTWIECRELVPPSVYLLCRNDS